MMQTDGSRCAVYAIPLLNYLLKVVPDDPLSRQGSMEEAPW